jgi:hypothetical protein
VLQNTSEGDAVKEKKTRTNKRTYFFKQKHKQKLKKKLALRRGMALRYGAHQYPVRNDDVDYWKDFPNHPWRKVEKHREIIRVRRACCLTDLQNVDIENFLIPIPRRFL